MVKGERLVGEHNKEICSLRDEREPLEQEAKQTRAETARLEDQIRESAVEDAKVSCGADRSRYYSLVEWFWLPISCLD